MTLPPERRLQAAATWHFMPLARERGVPITPQAHLRGSVKIRPDSTKIIALIQSKPICYTPLHELEFVNALQLKVFFQSATPTQVTAARGLVETDLKTGVLQSADTNWKSIFQEAVKLAEQHTGTFGCRSLDVLHCAAAKVLAADAFISTDHRQMKLASAMGLNLLPV